MDVINGYRNGSGSDAFKYAGGNKDVTSYRNAASNPYNKDTQTALFNAYNAGYADEDAPKDDAQLIAWIEGHSQHRKDYNHTLIPVNSGKKDGIAKRFLKWAGFWKTDYSNASGGALDVTVKQVIIVGGIIYIFLKRKQIAAFFNSLGEASKHVKV